MRHCIVTLTILFYVILAHGQNSISGRIIDKENKPIDFASVVLKKDNIVISTRLADSLGRYKIVNIKPGFYHILFSCINFEKKEIPINLIKDTVVNVQLTPSSSKQLDEIVITSTKPMIERKVDRTILNVENSPTSLGADGVDILSKVPGVKVARDKGKISLVGKGEVKVMIDDKLIQLNGKDLMNILESMSADDIAKIEVISNPGAQYDAVGNAGLINFVTKKSTKPGYTGMVRVGHTQTIYPTSLGGGNISYNNNKLKVHGNINVNDGSNNVLDQFTSFYPTQTWQQKNDKRDFNKSINGQVSIDFQATKSTSVGISYDGGTSKPNTQEIITTLGDDPLQINNYYTITNANNKINNNTNSINFHLKHLLDTSGKKISISGNWLTYQTNKQNALANTNHFITTNQVVPNSFSQSFSSGNQKINSYNFKTDLELPFKPFSFSLGGKFSFLNNKNENLYQFNSSETNQFDYNENIQAIYTQLGKKYKKWNFQLGLRGEFAQLTSAAISYNQINKRDYFQLFPSLSVTYNQSDKNIFFLNYGRRIDRPLYDELDPFRVYSSPKAYSEGNPFLQRSLSNFLEVSHTYDNFLTTALSFNHTTNGRQQVTYLDNSSSIQVTRFQNFLTSYSYELANIIVFNALKWLESSNTLVAFYQTVYSSLPTQDKTQGFGYYMATNNQIHLNKAKTVAGEVNFWCLFPSKYEIYSLGTIASLDLGLKVSMNKKIQLGFNVDDILKTNQVTGRNLISPVKQEFFEYTNSPKFRLSLGYKFGNSKTNRDNPPASEQGEQDRTKKKNSRY